MKGKNQLLWKCVIIGGVLGYVILHPYAMYIYEIYRGKHTLVSVMGLPFALVGILAGLFLGLWVANRRERDEAVKTMERLRKELAEMKQNTP